MSSELERSRFSTLTKRNHDLEDTYCRFFRRGILLLRNADRGTLSSSALCPPPLAAPPRVRFLPHFVDRPGGILHLRESTCYDLHSPTFQFHCSRWKSSNTFARALGLHDRASALRQTSARCPTSQCGSRHRRMTKVASDFMAPSPVVSARATSIQSVAKRGGHRRSFAPLVEIVASTTSALRTFTMRMSLKKPSEPHSPYRFGLFLPII